MRYLIPILCFCLLLFSITDCGGKTPPAEEMVPEPEEELPKVPPAERGRISKVNDSPLSELCRELSIDDVLFLNNIWATRSDALIDKLGEFVG